MKKLCFAIGLFFGLFILVKADSYEIADLGMKLDFPTNWAVFTRDNYKDNPLLEEYEITEEQLKSNFENYSVYLDAVNSEGVEIFVRMSKSELEKNLVSYSNSDLKEFVNTLKERTGATDYHIEKMNDIKWVTMEYQDKINKYYVLEAYTIVDKKAITITCQYPETFNETQKNEFKKILSDTTMTFEDPSRNIEPRNNTMYWILFGMVLAAIVGGYYGLEKKKKI